MKESKDERRRFRAAMCLRMQPFLKVAVLGIFIYQYTFFLFFRLIRVGALTHVTKNPNTKIVTGIRHVVGPKEQQKHH